MDFEGQPPLSRLSADARATQLIERFQRARERREKFEAALELAGHLIHGSRHQQAGQALEIARDYAQGVEDEARLCRLQANLLYRQGHFSEAAGQLEKMASRPDIVHYPLAFYIIRLEQSRVSFRQGYLEQAREFAAEAEVQLAAWQRGLREEKVSAAEEEMAWADLYHIKALLESSTGNHQAALSWYDREIEVLERLKAKGRLGLVYNNLSGLMKIRGNFYEALEYQHKAMAIARETQDQLSLAISHNNLAEIFYDLGDYAAAEEHYLRYLDMSRQISNRLGDTFGLAGLARIARDRGDFARAEGFLQQALAAAREVNSLSRQASILTEMGELYCRQGRGNQAEQALNQAVALCLKAQAFNSQRHQLLDAKIKLEAADILQDKRGSEELARIETMISEIMEQPPSLEDEEVISAPDLIREGYHLLARVQKLQGKTEEAIKSCQKAWAAVEEVLGMLPEEMRPQYLEKPEIKSLQTYRDNL